MPTNGVRPSLGIAGGEALVLAVEERRLFVSSGGARMQAARQRKAVRHNEVGGSDPQGFYNHVYATYVDDTVTRRQISNCSASADN